MGGGEEGGKRGQERGTVVKEVEEESEHAYSLFQDELT